MTIRIAVFVLALLSLAAPSAARGDGGGVPAPAAPPEVEDRFTKEFPVDAADWTSKGTNPYFVLEPGYALVLEGMDDGEAARLTITVLDDTKTVAGVETRVVEEREEHAGHVVEISRNYFALSKRTNDVYYFGEDVDMYRKDVVVGHEGSWLAGEKGARYGLTMAGTPLLGARYYQEVAPDIALDRAEVASLAESITTPGGAFTKCLNTAETSGLEKGTEHKVYARGVGLVKEGPLLLVKHGPRK